ncbi:MAG TPA: MFS transporter [Acidimicrobiales bacterium]|nr:MFS transporter [Acidimicrobiales bacterium]
MPLDNGWEPLSKPPRRTGAEAFVITPFTRLARTHAAAVAGDTLIALALANSLFFDIDPNAARSKVALYLALTMAPFAVVAPLIGPALDRMRGGRRFMVIGANALRAVICVLMIGHLESMLLFPEAFAVLVLAKSYHVAKSAIVPTVVRSDTELVEANSRLSFLSGVVTFGAAIPGGLAFLVAGSQGVLVLAVIVFAVAAGFGLRLPATQVAADHTSETEREELRGGGIVLAASAMGLLRGIVGFLTFLVAFALRTSDAPTYQFGLVVAASGIGSLLGALVAPALRRNGTPEERILQIVLAATGVAGVLAAWSGGIVAASALALCVGMAASSGKLAFDSVVQRDAPDANRGRSFARFETRFQLTWVIGAFLPVVISIPMEIGFLVVAGCAVFAVVSYLAGLRALARGEVPTRRRPTQVIGSRLRRRRQGFSVPATGDEPAVASIEDDTGGRAYRPEGGTVVDASADAPADERRAVPPAATPGPYDRSGADPIEGQRRPVPIEDDDADDDAEPGRPTHARDHVVIDPTNL